jgi:CheY-like chemotaxis protein
VATGGPAERLRILVINDEDPVRLLVRINLEHDRGWEIIEAAEGTAGLAAAREQQPNLILLGTMMPGPDGWEVAQQLSSDPCAVAA